MENRVKSTLSANKSNGSAATFKHLTKNNLLKANFSEDLQTFIVDIHGATLTGEHIDVSRIYDELHPLMAVGRAVVEFSKQYAGCRIDYLTYQQKIIK